MFYIRVTIMLEFKVRKVRCLHSGHVLLFGSVQRVPSSISTVMGDWTWQSDVAMGQLRVS